MTGLAALVGEGRISPDWAKALTPCEAQLQAVLAAVDREEAAGVTVLPPRERVLRAFETPLSQVRVIIVGQDPYPTPGHGVGLAFSVDRAVSPIPRSLTNVYRELESDLGISPAVHGDLGSWRAQGVLLLNRVLTVRAGAAASHTGLGWEEVTEEALRVLAARGGPLVAVLWGNHARKLAPILGDIPVIESAHPSPLSASRGFFGSRPFSRVNDVLRAQGATPIDWRIT